MSSDKLSFPFLWAKNETTVELIWEHRVQHRQNAVAFAACFEVFITNIGRTVCRSFISETLKPEFNFIRALSSNLRHRSYKPALTEVNMKALSITHNQVVWETKFQLWWGCLFLRTIPPVLQINLCKAFFTWFFGYKILWIYIVDIHSINKCEREWIHHNSLVLGQNCLGNWDCICGWHSFSLYKAMFCLMILPS